MAKSDVATPLLSLQLPGFTSIVAGHVAAVPGVAYLELARPQRHNAFDEQLWVEFPRALRELDADDKTRVIVVSGQGMNFCAGIDVGYLQRNFMSLVGPSGLAAAASPGGPPGGSDYVSGSGSAGGSSTVGGGGPSARQQQPVLCPGSQRASMRRGILALQDAYTELERCRSPVIAAVHGRCIGGGVDLVTACDLRLASEDASFCVKEVDLAIAADLGTLQRLPHIVGHGTAMDLALTARTVGAAEAQRIGLVSAVVPVPASPSLQPEGPSSSSSSSSVGGGGGGSAGGGAGQGGGPRGAPGRAAVVSAALRLAASIASKPQLAVQGTKRVLLHARDQPRVSDGLDYVATWNSAQLLSADLQAVMGGGAPGAAGRGARRNEGAGYAGSGARSRL